MKFHYDLAQSEPIIRDTRVYNSGALSSGTAMCSSHDATVVYDIACKRTLKPYMFFYGINMDDMLPSGFYVVITSIKRWHKDRDIDNSDLSDFIMPLFLTKIKDSTYTAKDMSPSQIRRELVKSGFVERHEVAGL